jgi:hypothetical protein|tara:strand:+ start:130 stop:444 length:315 start_codon:yes stop_codon:yes gene_type:complete
MKYIGKNYADFDSKRKWELIYENMFLVIIDNNIKLGLDINLLGIDATSLKVKWELGGIIENEKQYDGIVNIYIKDNFVYAGTYSGFDLKIDYKTGKILEKVFRK